MRPVAQGKFEDTPCSFYRAHVPAVEVSPHLGPVYYFLWFAFNSRFQCDAIHAFLDVLVLIFHTGERTTGEIYVAIIFSREVAIVRNHSLVVDMHTIDVDHSDVSSL